ncbi:MAG: D-ribose pyranase [Bacteroidia bacterium]|nr:D-ribose pyranase [Bacteroidia bacterium]
MKEAGIINREIAAAITKQGHTDLLMVVDAGFAIPNGVEVIDISLGENKPTVPEVLEELKKFFSVEKLIMANQTKNVSPTLFANISKAFGEGVPVETFDQSSIREMSKSVKTVIRTGDFTAYGNVILVSGAGNRWKVEKPG